MCGRFTASFEFREIKLLFNLQRDILVLTARYNIAYHPKEVPVIVRNNGVNELLKPMKWGLVRPEPPIDCDHMINVHAETITRPSDRRLVESKRCLIPANGFYEWLREENLRFSSGFT